MSGADVRAPAPDAGAPPPPEPTRSPSWARLSFYVASLGLLLWAALTVPLPFVEYVPGEPTPIEPLLTIDGAETTPLDGSTSLLTVFLRQQPTLPVLRAAFDDRRRLMPVEQVFPSGTDRSEFFQEERARFTRQFEVAAAVGAQAAGVETRLVTEAVVVAVGPTSPAAGLLRAGDVIRTVDGEPIEAGEELVERTRRGELGEQLRLGIERDGVEEEVVVTLGEVPELDHPGLGVSVQTAVDDLVLPFEIGLAPDIRIGGPSAGMMTALTVFDLLSDEDLLRGRTVMGTGTLDADGRVGAVGGVPEKMLAASAAGADLVLVPGPQLEAAMSTAPDDLEVVAVDTFEQALAALRR